MASVSPDVDREGTLLFEPRRRVVLAAKLAAAAFAGILFAVICVAICFGAGLTLLAARNLNVALTVGHTVVLVFGTVAAYAFAIDAVLFAAVPSAGRYVPGKASDGLAGLPTAHLLTPGLGAAALAVWTLAFVAIATARNDRSDI
jgi:hypothetical protein